MAVKDVFKVNRKTFFDPSGWFGFDVVKENTKLSWAVVKEVFTAKTPTAEATENFAEAQKRLRVSEQDLIRLNKYFFTIAWVFLIAAILAFVFAVVIVLDGYFFGFVFALSATVLFLGQAFKYHFRYFQIKKRKLGCTLAEWRQELFSSK